MTSEPIASTIVWHGDKAWRVSTINRNSSAGREDYIYSETLVWVWNPKTRDIEGNILEQLTCFRGSLVEHIRAVDELHKLGRLTVDCPACDGNGTEWVTDGQGYITERECSACGGTGRADHDR